MFKISKLKGFYAILLTLIVFSTFAENTIKFSYFGSLLVINPSGAIIELDSNVIFNEPYGKRFYMPFRIIDFLGDESITSFSDVTTCNLFPYKFFSQQTGKTKKYAFEERAFTLGKFIEELFKKTPLKVSLCTISQKPKGQLEHSIPFGKFPFKIFEAKNNNHRIVFMIDKAGIVTLYFLS